MTLSFENSRCNEILDAAFSRAGNNSFDGTLPLEARIVVMLTILAETALIRSPHLSPKESQYFTLRQVDFLRLLIPELHTPEGIALYQTLGKTFMRDMKDLNRAN